MIYRMALYICIGIVIAYSRHGPHDYHHPYVTPFLVLTTATGLQLLLLLLSFCRMVGPLANTTTSLVSTG